MRVLLDECLPKRLKFEIDADFVRTVPEAEWAGKKNGELLRLAEREYDVLLTVDQNLEHQQDLPGFDLAVVVLQAKSSDLDDLRPLMPRVNELLKRIQVGQTERVIGD